LPSRVIGGARGERWQPPERDPSLAPEEQERRRVEAAVRAGYEEGLRKGREEALAAVAAERERLARALAAVHALERDVLARLEGEIVDLAIAVAERIVRARIEAGDEVAVRVAREAIAACGETGGVRVRMHPEDVALARERAPELEAPGLVELVADPSLARGDVLVETEMETLDARVRTALLACREELAGEPA